MNSFSQFFLLCLLLLMTATQAHARYLNCPSVGIQFISNDRINMISESYQARDLEPDSRSRSELTYSMQNKYFGVYDVLQISVPLSVYSKREGDRINVKIKRGGRNAPVDAETCKVADVADILCYLTAREKNGKIHKFELQRKLSVTTYEGFFTSVDGNGSDANYQRLFPKSYSNAIISATNASGNNMRFKFNSGTKNGLIENLKVTPEDGLIGKNGRFTASFNFIPWISAEVPFGKSVYLNDEKNLNREAAISVNVICRIN